METIIFAIPLSNSVISISLKTWLNTALYLENIKKRQDHDEKLMQSKDKYPTWYSCKTVNNGEVILCYTKSGDNPA